MLQQPFTANLMNCNRILIAGAGGGYDLIGAIPLLVELLKAGKTVHLASLTFTDYHSLPNVQIHPLLSNLASVRPDSASRERYCPEVWLSQWLETEVNYSKPVWLFKKTGVMPLQAAYEHLVTSFDIDAIVLIDGGIDAVLRGDETSLGTPIEDLTSLCAVSRVSGPATFLGCLGMTAELRDGICHSQFLSRVAELNRANAFLGILGLSSLTDAGKAYSSVVDFIFQHQVGLRQSHIQRVVLNAMQGGFGPAGIDVWLSPLLPIYWFFDLPTVAATHLFMQSISTTETSWQVSVIIEGIRKTMTLQSPSTIPI